MELETDEEGFVTFLPVISWSVTIAQGKTVGLAIDYVASAADAAASRLSRIQLHLDPASAQLMGRAMDERGGMVLAADAPGR
jgi:hypothetical protein